MPSYKEPEKQADAYRRFKYVRAESEDDAVNKTPQIGDVWRKDGVVKQHLVVYGHSVIDYSEGDLKEFEVSVYYEDITKIN